MIELKIKLSVNPEKNRLSRQMVNDVETIEWLRPYANISEETKKEISNKILGIVKELFRLMAVDFSILKDDEINLSSSGLLFDSDDVAFIVEKSYFHKSCNFRFDSEDFVFEITSRNEDKHIFTK
jgi:hypothetical protein